MSLSIRAVVLWSAALALALSGRSQAAARMENFRLSDQDGRPQELFRYADRKAVVLIVQENGCPIFQQSVPNILSLRDRFKSKGVAFLLINPNPGDSRRAVVREMSDYGVDIPVLFDRSQAVVKSLGVLRTAESLVVDPKTWEIVYRGAIDDGLHYGAQKPVTQRYVQDAIEAVLAGRKPSIERTEAFGCLIQYKKKPSKTIR